VNYLAGFVYPLRWPNLPWNSVCRGTRRKMACGNSRMVGVLGIVVPNATPPSLGAGDIFRRLLDDFGKSGVRTKVDEPKTKLFFQRKTPKKGSNGLYFEETVLNERIVAV
jgi:hypothetical protein